MNTKKTEIHPLLKPRFLEEEDFDLVHTIIHRESFKEEIHRALGMPIKISIDDNDNSLRFDSHKGTKYLSIETLLAAERGQIH